MTRKQPLRSLLVLGLLAGLGAQASGKETWVEVRSPHFVAYSDAGESEARALLRQFEEIRTVFLKVFPKIQVDDPRPTVLLVTRDEASMKRFLPGSFEGDHPKRESGVFCSCPERNYAILRLDAGSRSEHPHHVLFHEYTHGIIRLNFQGIPTWLDEGIADFYGTTEIQSDRVLIGRLPREVLATLHEKSPLPLETLVSVDPGSPHYRDGDKADVFYAQSALLVHYLFMDPQAQKAGLFSNYLKALEGRPDPVAAAKDGFGDLDKLRSALTTYARQPTFLFWTYPLAARISDKDYRSRRLDPAQVLVLRAEFFQDSGQEPAARPFVEEALKLNPGLPEAHAAVGFGHLQRGESPEAKASFETAVRLGSGDFRVYYHLAQLLQHPAHPLDPQVLDYLETARRLRPDFAPTRGLLGMEYAKDPARASRGVEEMRTAVQLDPGNLTHLANLGVVYMNLDREAEARAVLERLKAQVRTSGDRAVAEQYEGALERFLGFRRTAVAQAPTPPPGALPTVDGRRALSFQLPSHLAPLGQEVLRLAGQGKVEEALRQVETARAKAKYDLDRKSLKALADQLRALLSKAAPGSEAPAPPRP